MNHSFDQLLSNLDQHSPSDGSGSIHRTPTDGGGGGRRRTPTDGGGGGR